MLSHSPYICWSSLIVKSDVLLFDSQYLITGITDKQCNVVRANLPSAWVKHGYNTMYIVCNINTGRISRKSPIKDCMSGIFISRYRDPNYSPCTRLVHETSTVIQVYFIPWVCFVCISHHAFICICFHLGLWPSGFWIKIHCNCMCILYIPYQEHSVFVIQTGRQLL